ncbi:hypothetical protein [Kitasatospora sp. NBC_01302]|uniref:hypothetical protein n=1 Tax=Kitasatospora sp. NBC_01302 TaxID=2903575 RepID=UPI002E107A69|nr:hypothetical protein OG294_02055 [Kitasatospora sp. NBC_01302]
MRVHHPALADLHGVWRRTLVREADGSTDTTTRTTWLQGLALFTDLRQPAGLAETVRGRPPAELDRPQLLALSAQKAFAGVLEQEGEVFGWARLIDLHPPAPLADAGTLRFEDGVLIEHGVHEDYLEHWERDDQPSDDLAGAVLEDPAEGCAGQLVRVGAWFGYARGRTAPLHTSGPRSAPLAEQVLGCAGRAEAAALLDCEVSLGRIRDGRWEIVRSTLPHRVGAELRPEPTASGDALRILDADPHGRARERQWRLARVEGSSHLLVGARDLG